MRKLDAKSIRLLAAKQVAALEGLPSESMLKVYRTQRANNGNVPESIKIKGRVYYRRVDVEKWLKQSRDF
jgi:hypothetical protein